MAQNPICQALNLSDSQPCKAIATSWDNVFCKFHGKQCYGLYVGYKRRNARLDSLSEDAPPYLRETKVPLANETFEGVTTKKTLKEIHDHIYSEYVLLGQVIDARRLHHEHFYPRQMDYGHQAYLDRLSNRRYIVLEALKKLDKRITLVLYESQRWYKWVREAQQAEEAIREKESKKVKRQAAMFKRNQDRVTARLQVRREKEERRRQDAYLDAIYQERMSASTDNDDDAETWDPIEDAIDDERNKYLDLVKHFLWMETSIDDENPVSNAPDSAALSTSMGNMTMSESEMMARLKHSPLAQSGRLAMINRVTNEMTFVNGNSSQSEAGTAASNAEPGGPVEPSEDGQVRVWEMIDDGVEGESSDRPPKTCKGTVETELEMRRRLKEGVLKKNVAGAQLIGVQELFTGEYWRTAPLADEEIDSLARDIKEIKLLLFCRLLLSHASLLPAAVRASSVEEFLNDPEIAASDLRDVCLRVEMPSLQDIRDACADLARGDEPEEVEEEEEIDVETFVDVIKKAARYSYLQVPLKVKPPLRPGEKVDKKVDKMVDKKPSQKRMKVRVCGKSIWNYSSESSMSRDGWFQFSIMAKDCDLAHAVRLCRNWDELSQLDLLTYFEYFPASNWTSFGSEIKVQMQHQLGFFPYFEGLDGGVCYTTPIEIRDIIAGQMRRGGPVVRRFIKYLTMRTDVFFLVRDGKTGAIITAPAMEDLWIIRRKRETGHASESEWDILLQVGLKCFNAVENLRKWHLGFEDYYDVWIWSSRPGPRGPDVLDVICQGLRKAWRHTGPADVYTHNEALLRNLTRDKISNRVRSIRAGEQVSTLWDGVNDPTGPEFRGYILPYEYYNEADAAEDMVFFPDEQSNNPFKKTINSATHMKEVMPTRALAKYVEAVNAEQKRTEETQSRIEQKRILSSHRIRSPIWEDAFNTIRSSHMGSEREQLLRRVGLLHESSDVVLGGIDKPPVYPELEGANNIKCRNAATVEALHSGDLEPGAQEKYAETYKILHGILGSPQTSGSTDWVWFLVTILDWLEMRADCDTFDPKVRSHPFVVQDIVQAFVLMALFFPDLEICQPATNFFKSEQGEEYWNTYILKPHVRSKMLPDRRSRASLLCRPKEFWNKWANAQQQKFIDRKEYTEGENSYVSLLLDEIPMKSNVAIRSIVAKLYVAGIIEPGYSQRGYGKAIAATEPHRPDQLDLFIYYLSYSRKTDGSKIVPEYVSPTEWPVLLPLAKAFASGNRGARFAVLRLWSAPHFYPIPRQQSPIRSDFMIDDARF